jgi:hypothetical protein
MIKEEVLKDLQDLVQSLPGDRLKDETFRSLWTAKRDKVDQAVAALNDEDQKWLDHHYNIWYNNFHKKHFTDKPLT